MHFALRRKSLVPLFIQIADRLEASIRRGTLRRDHRLQSARVLAADLGVSRLTVEAAFARLERAGLVERRQGSGTFVLFTGSSVSAARLPAAVPAAWPQWQLQLPATPVGHKASPARARYDFSSGMGDPGLIPAGEFRRALLGVIRQEGTQALVYEDPQGFPPLRAAIAEILSSQGLPARAENILITSGAQQAISLTARALLKAGDTVFVEELCYDSALNLFGLLGLKIIAVPMDDDGLRLDCLEALLHEHRPKLLYCMPNFQNPTGRVLHASRRQALVDLAAAHGMAILEDDYVGELRYDGTAAACLKTLDHQGGGVLYTSTFSKMLMPGLRLGFVLAEGPVLGHLVSWKRHMDLSCPSLLQRALHAYVSVGRYRRHVRKACSVYAQRRDACVASLRRHFPSTVRFVVPRGGFFVWLHLPQGLIAADLLPKARALGVDFANGARFEAQLNEGARPCIRLNFASSEIPDIEAGLRILGQLVRDELAQSKRQGRPRSPRVVRRAKA